MFSFLLTLYIPDVFCSFLIPRSLFFIPRLPLSNPNFFHLFCFSSFLSLKFSPVLFFIFSSPCLDAARKISGNRNRRYQTQFPVQLTFFAFVHHLSTKSVFMLRVFDFNLVFYGLSRYDGDFVKICLLREAICD